jgi:hypothetical protein
VNHETRNANEHSRKYDEKIDKKRRKTTKRRKRGEREENVNGGVTKRKINNGDEHREIIRIKSWRRAKRNRYEEEKGNEREEKVEVDGEGAECTGIIKIIRKKWG